MNSFFNQELLSRKWHTPDYSPVVIPERLLALDHPKYNRLVSSMILKYQIAIAKIEGKSVIDICCGSGFGADLMSRSGFNVTGIDSDPNVIKTICSLRNAPNLKFIHGNLFHDLGLGKFDGATCIDAIEHFLKEDQQAAMNHIKRYLNVGGILVIDTPLNRESYRQSRHHPWVLSWRDFGDLVESVGFSIMERYIIRQEYRQSFLVKYILEPKLDKTDYENGLDQVIIAKVK